jgi:intein/homing endonuclease
MVSTYSMWSLFRSCRKAVDWRYIEQLVPLLRDHNLHFGSLIHECLELWHGERDLAKVLDRIDRLCPNRAQDEDQKRDWLNATAMMRGYAEHYPAEEFEIVALEKTFEGPIVNPATGAASRSFVLAGKIDGIVRVGGDHFLLEHKCVTGGSRIYDYASGELLEVREMAERQIAPLVLGIDERGRLRRAQAGVPRPDKIRDVFRVVLKSGRTLTVSDNHPVLTHRGWVPAGTLKKDDWAAVPWTTGAPREESPFSDDDVRLAGYMLADGTLSSLAFSKSEGPVLDDFLAVVGRLGIRCQVQRREDRVPQVRLSRAPDSPARLLMDRLGLYEECAPDKHLPDVLHSITDRQVGILLGALWSTDGCVDIYEEKRPDYSRIHEKIRIAYVSRSHALCSGIQRLLLRLGINSSVTRSSVRYREERRPVFVTRVIGRTSKRRFLELASTGAIPILKYAEVLRDALTKVKPGEDPRMEPSGLPTWLQRAEVFWDRVEVVTVSGRQLMYDLTVPEINSFVVDDVITHNTASQLDADYLEKLWTDFQITLYAHYIEQTLGIPITGILYNVLVKARLQQSKGETEEEFQVRRAELLAKSKTGRTTAKRKLPESDEEFAARLAEKYADPLMFHREMLYLSRDRFDILRSELWELTQAFLDARRRGVFYQNTAFCFNYQRPCAYFALCRSNGNPNVRDNFYQRVVPNEELRVLPATTTEPAF